MMYAIIGPERSGTTLAFKIVRDLSEDFKSDLPAEFFHSVYNKKTGPNIPYDIVDTTEGLQFVPSRQRSNRIELLKKYDCSFTVKVTSINLDYDLIDFLATHYTIILVERMDLFDQFLSRILALRTGLWSSSYPLDRSIEPFILPVSEVDSYFGIMNKWIEFKRYINNMVNVTSIFYEDMIINDPYKYVSNLLGKSQEPTEFFKPTVKLYTKVEKESLIINLDEIKAHWNRSIS